MLNYLPTKKSKANLLKKLSEVTKPSTLQLLIVAIASIAVYFNALFDSFVFDDIHQVLENQWIRDIRFLPTIFSHDAWGFYTSASVVHYYRPMMHLIYMFNYHVFGLKPWGFHLVNILFHAGVSVLVLIIAKHHLLEIHSSTSNTFLSPAFIAGILFATHPIHTEVVTWVAAVPELAFTFFCLLSFYFYIRSEEGFKGGYLLSLISFALALFSKETALTLPIIIGAYDYAIEKDSSQHAKEYIKRYLPYLIIIGLYLGLRSYALRDVPPVEKVVELGAYGYIINCFSFFMYYLGKLILPIHLNALHVFHPISSILEPEGLLAVTVTATFVVLMFKTVKKDKIIFWCLILIIVPLIPTFYIIGNSEVGISERYLYLPSFGYVLLLALMLEKVRVNRPNISLVIAITLSVLLGLYSFGTVRRNSTWKDEYSFWADTSRKSPDSAVARVAFGVALFNRGNIDGALKEFLIATKLNPNYVDAHWKLALAYKRKNLINNAIAEYEVALRLWPSAEAHDNLGKLYDSVGMSNKAIEHYQAAIRQQPNDPKAYNNLGIIYAKMGLIDRALENFEIAVKIDPNEQVFRRNLERAYEIRKSSHQGSQ